MRIVTVAGVGLLTVSLLHFRACDVTVVDVDLREGANGCKATLDQKNKTKRGNVIVWKINNRCGKDHEIAVEDFQFVPGNKATDLRCLMAKTFTVGQTAQEWLACQAVIKDDPGGLLRIKYTFRVDKNAEDPEIQVHPGPWPMLPPAASPSPSSSPSPEGKPSPSPSPDGKPSPSPSPGESAPSSR